MTPQDKPERFQFNEQVLPLPTERSEGQAYGGPTPAVESYVAAGLRLLERAASGRPASPIERPVIEGLLVTLQKLTKVCEQALAESRKADAYFPGLASESANRSLSEAEDIRDLKDDERSSRGVSPTTADAGEEKPKRSGRSLRGRPQ